MSRVLLVGQCLIFVLVGIFRIKEKIFLKRGVTQKFTICSHFNCMDNLSNCFEIVAKNRTGVLHNSHLVFSPYCTNHCQLVFCAYYTMVSHSRFFGSSAPKYTSKSVQIGIFCPKIVRKIESPTNF